MCTNTPSNHIIANTILHKKLIIHGLDLSKTSKDNMDKFFDSSTVSLQKAKVPPMSTLGYFCRVLVSIEISLEPHLLCMHGKMLSDITCTRELLIQRLTFFISSF